MLDYTQTDNKVKLSRRKRRVENICLCHAMIRAEREVARISVDRRAQVNRSDARAFCKKDFGEPARATTGFQHLASSERAKEVNPQDTAQTLAR